MEKEMVEKLSLRSFDVKSGDTITYFLLTAEELAH